MTFGNKLRRITLFVALFSGSASVLSGAELLKTAPKEVGLRADRLTEITRLLQRGVEKQQIAGGVAIVLRHGKVAYRKAIGYSDTASKSPMQTDHLFRIASMTKPVTSVAVMMLRDEGQLDLSDPVSKYIPEFAKAVVAVADKQGRLDAEHYQTVPARREITIRDLLTHTSGVTYPFYGQEPQHTLFKKIGVADGLSETTIDLTENAKRIAKVPLVNQPGEAWQYSLSTDVLGRVVEIASGQSLAEFFRQRIFEPLGMSNTYFFLPEEKISRLATLYRPGSDKKIEPVGSDLQTLGPVAWSSTYQCEGPKTYFSGGGGLVSSPNDYAMFLQMMLQGGTSGGRQLLAQSTVAEMVQNQIGDLETSYPIHGKKCGYGFGIAEKAIATGAPAGSYSWGGAFHTFFWVDPKNDLVAILMTQLFPTDHLAMRSDFQRCVYDAIADDMDHHEVLFNGKNLEGWDGDPRFWSVVDGAIVGETTEDNKVEKNTFLVYRGREFADFELSFLYQVKGFNSGVQYRSKEGEKWTVAGYQADFEDRWQESSHGLIDKYSGMLYEENGRGFLALRGETIVVRSNVDDSEKPTFDKVAHLGEPDELEKLIRRDGWNEYRVLARGFQFTHIINGRVMVICVDDDVQNRSSSGILAFQLHSGSPMRIRIKDVKIRVVVAE